MKIKNIQIPEDLHRRVKATAALEGATIVEWTIKALESNLLQEKRQPAKKEKAIA
jgi:predicted HicB family RNase H-like nuclease